MRRTLEWSEVSRPDRMHRSAAKWRPLGTLPWLLPAGRVGMTWCRPTTGGQPLARARLARSAIGGRVTVGCTGMLGVVVLFGPCGNDAGRVSWGLSKY